MTATGLLRSLLPKSLWSWAGKRRDGLLAALFRREALNRLQAPRSGNPHGLPAELIVSLTSYPPRFGTLHLTLACLLDQTVRPDKVLLWIAQADLNELPRSVRELEGRGLEIRPCEDIRSYKKLVPALAAFPEAFVATADDDLHYPPDWLENLVAGMDVSVPTITCHRAHRPRFVEDGSMAPYLSWDLDIRDGSAAAASADIIPTSGAGALYPPHGLHPMVTDRSIFERLSPSGDDLWFYWCARMAGTKIRKVCGRFRLISWRGSQDASLWQDNERGGNDRMIEALAKAFPLDRSS